MNCWVCDGAGVKSAALATCPTCGVGLCRDHRLAQARGAAGTAIECRHLVESEAGKRLRP
jgi:hypothetical protein